MITIKAQNYTVPNSDSLLVQHLQLIDNLTDSFLYNPDCFVAGKLYYPRGTKDNHPYFGEFNWKPGTIVYGGIKYQIPTMKFDIEEDAPVVMKTIGTMGYPVQLDTKMIREFFIDGRYFVFLDGTKNPGYYELLYDSYTTVWAKWEKRNANPIGGSPKYSSNLRFLVLKDRIYYQVRTLNEFYDVFSDKEEELKRFKKKEKLSFRINKTGTIKTLTEHYDLLTK